MFFAMLLLCIPLLHLQRIFQDSLSLPFGSSLKDDFQLASFLSSISELFQI